MGKGLNRVNFTRARLAGATAKSNGSQFEELIDHACLRYKALKLAYIEKTPEPMKPLGRPDAYGHFTAVYTKAAQPDYKGTLKGGRSIVFEAKHTNSMRIEKIRVNEEQAASLSRHQQLGAICFVLVSFRFENYYVVPWDIWKNMEEHFYKKSVNESDLLPYLVPGITQFLKNPLTQNIITNVGRGTATVKSNEATPTTKKVKDWPSYLDYPLK